MTHSSEIRASWARGDTVDLAALKHDLCQAAAKGEKLSLAEWGLAEGHLVTPATMISGLGAAPLAWDLVQSVVLACNPSDLLLTKAEYLSAVECAMRGERFAPATNADSGDARKKGART